MKACSELERLAKKKERSYKLPIWGIKKWDITLDPTDVKKWEYYKYLFHWIKKINEII